MQARARAEVGFRAGICVAVPGADKLAVVAAVDAVAHQGPELFRDRAIVLDGEIGDAAAAIHHIGCDNGAGRADVDAGDALAALLLRYRLVERQRQVEQQLAEKKKEPADSLSSSECLPTQPRPALAASGRSRMGAESTKGRHSPKVSSVP